MGIPIKSGVAPTSEQPPKAQVAPTSEQPPKVEVAPTSEQPPKAQLAAAPEQPPKAQLAAAPEQPPKVEVAPTHEQPPTDAVPIDDSVFESKLSLLEKIQTTILFEKIKIDEKDRDLLDFSKLHTLAFASDALNQRTRRATLVEWEDLENRLLKLPAYLSDRQIAKIQLNRVTGILLLYPIYLLLVSVGSLIGYSSFSPALKVPFFILWLATTGGLGSAAFIYVNALSIQVDPTVDVVSPGLVSMRVVLAGC